MESHEFVARTLDVAKSKLRWGTSNGVWSVSLLPEEARVLIEHIDALETPFGTIDDREMPQYGMIEDRDMSR